MKKLVARLGTAPRRPLVGTIVVAGLLVAAPVAYGVSAVISDTNLTGGGGTTWDPDSDTYACTTPPSITNEGFTPISNGATASPARSDAFDDAFVVWVNGIGGSIFRDVDGFGNRKGQSLSVGPTKTGGLSVSQTEVALQTSGTLRMLYKFKNPKGHKVTRTIALESNLGSDAATTVDASSTGDTSWTKADRWLVTHQAPFDSGSDPVVTQVWYGKHAAKRVGHTEHTDADADCFLSRFSIALKPHKARYLMFFAEMNADSIADGVSAAHKFNHRHLNAKLLKGLGDKVRSRILNWDL